MSEPLDKTAIINVAVIEDQREIGEALAELIDSSPGLQCSGFFRTAEAAIEGFAKRVPDVALVDLGLPLLSGVDAIRLLKELYPSLASLVLTVFDDETHIFDALCAGAVGYLVKKTPPGRIVQSIKETVAGGAVMSPAVAKKVIRLFQTVAPPKNVSYNLTPQESRILGLLVEGHTYNSIAAELEISRNTVSTHLKRVYDKLQVHSKSEAVSKAMRSRLRY